MEHSIHDIPICSATQRAYVQTELHDYFSKTIAKMECLITPFFAVYGLLKLIIVLKTERMPFEVALQIVPIPSVNHGYSTDNSSPFFCRLRKESFVSDSITDAKIRIKPTINFPVNFSP